MAALRRASGHEGTGLKDHVSCLTSYGGRRHERVPERKCALRLGGNGGELICWKLERPSSPSGWNCPEAGSSPARQHSSPRAYHQQHLMREPHHNLHNCRTIRIQPNVPSQPAIITLPRPGKHHAPVILSSSPRKTTRETAHTSLKRDQSRD